MVMMISYGGTAQITGSKDYKTATDSGRLKKMQNVQSGIQGQYCHKLTTVLFKERIYYTVYLVVQFYQWFKFISLCLGKC